MAERPAMLAAVDLGSNSFRMVIARILGDELQMVDRLREGVRLAAYLDRRKRINAEGEARAMEALAKFGQRVRDLPTGSVRAVGTNTLRKAKDREGFIERAELALGHPVEVVSGLEEARLIFLGVSHGLGISSGRRLVVDIGGGSTECIVGEAFEPQLAESLYMGCVSFTLEHFPNGEIKEDFLRRAELAAQLELRAAKRAFRKSGWESCAGASGTVHAVAEILLSNGWGDGQISRRGLRKLRKALISAGHVDRLNLKGLRKERAKVLPGGVAILGALFDSLRIETMGVSPGAMREGVLYDLLGRIRDEDVRNRTIQRLMQRFDADREQARRVERTALLCLGQAVGPWDLDLQRARPLLVWGASLHEVGLAIAHSGYHKHGSYLVSHCDLPGFSLDDQRLLALMVRSHRRKIPKSMFHDLPTSRSDTMLRSAILLRMAVLLNRSRSRRPLPDFRLLVQGRNLELRLPAPWLEDNPLTRADLEMETGYLAPVGYTLSYADL